jgi:predicted kinase
VLLPNAALVRTWRAKVIKSFRKFGAKVVLVYFDIPDDVLRDRIKKAKREKSMLTVSKDFYQVLDKQNKYLFNKPSKTEVDYFFTISSAKGYDRVSKSVQILMNKHK